VGHGADLKSPRRLRRVHPDKPAELWENRVKPLGQQRFQSLGMATAWFVWSGREFEMTAMNVNPNLAKSIPRPPKTAKERMVLDDLTTPSS
jgi:hypothetical protein